MKNTTSATENFRFNEILFENRNKSYGAYVLRNEESAVLQKSLFLGVALFGLLSISPFLVNAFTSSQIIDEPVLSGHVLKPVDEIPDVEPPVKITVTPPQKIESTVKIEIPTPTRDAVKETPPPTVREIVDTRIGTETVVGTPSTDTYTPPVTAPATNVVVDVPEAKPVNNDPVTVVDVEAGFAGGINAFRSKVVQNFDTGDFEGSGETMKTTVTFIVEKDGTISSVTANGKDADFNKEAVDVVKKVKGRWTPAKLNGENVRSYFKFPISMQFE